jgi:hypothetical protein
LFAQLQVHGRVVAFNKQFTYPACLFDPVNHAVNFNNGLGNRAGRYLMHKEQVGDFIGLISGG